MGALSSLEPGPDPLVGKVLQERYRVVRRIGAGGMGAVYEGEHLLIRKRVAIKVLHPQFATSGDIVARFHQEALAATRIGHQNIVEVNDLGRTPEGGIFMVLEYLQGEDFASLLAREPLLPIGRIIHILSQVCDAVRAAHEKGIVHRDLKPENIFLVTRGDDRDFVKVLDFGISKFQGGSAEDSGHSGTKTGAVIGTAYYMSPEQAQGRRTVDHRTDIWALGVILYRALTGVYPFDDEAYPMLILKICTETAAPLRQTRPDVPAGLAAVAHACLERDVAKRVQNCGDLRAQLMPFAVAQSGLANTMAIPGTDSTGPIPALDGDAARRLLSPAPGASTPIPTAQTPRPSAPSSSPGVNASTPFPSTSPSSTPPSDSAIRAVIPTPSRAPIYVAAIAVAALLGLGGWTLFGSHGAPPSTVTPDPIGAPPSSIVLAPPTSIAPPPSAADAHLTFIVSPAEAVVLVDGRPLPADSNGEILAPVNADDAAMHELRVEARGFRTRIEDLRLSYTQRVVVSLDPGTGEDDRRARHAPSGGGATTPRHGPRTGTPPPHTGGEHTPPPLLTTE